MATLAEKGTLPQRLVGLSSCHDQHRGEEDHISWIILAKDCVYKLKKPVRYPFLDFNALRRCRFYCEKEIRLNRRLAGETYLGVIPLRFEQIGGLILKSRTRAWTFILLVRGQRSIRSAMFYTEHVTLKLLPLDDKTNLQGVLDLPKGSWVEGTDRALQIMVNRLRVPEIVSFQTYTGTAAPFRLQRTCALLWPVFWSRASGIAVNLQEKGDRGRARMPSRSISASTSRAPLPQGTVPKVVEPLTGHRFWKRYRRNVPLAAYYVLTGAGSAAQKQLQTCSRVRSFTLLAPPPQNRAGVELSSIALVLLAAS